MLRLRPKRSAASWKRLDSTPEATRPERLQQLHVVFGFTVTVVIWIVPAGAFSIHGNRDRPNFRRQYEECKSRHDCELPQEERHHRRKGVQKIISGFDLKQVVYE